MLSLSRTVRFAIPLAPDATSGTSAPHNTFAAFPPPQGLSLFTELVATCRGTPDPETGYFINIAHIDRAVREHALPRFALAVHESRPQTPHALLAEATAALAPALNHTLDVLAWHVSPYHVLKMHTSDKDTYLIEEVFDFAAAHRLHVPSLSDQQNRQVFGKCNNPSGHGHNYRVKPTVKAPINQTPSFDFVALERAVHESIITRYDHTHLNIDTPEFSPPDGRNPTVENIAKVFFDRLSEYLRTANPDVDLVSITVWETEKTSCTFPAP